MDRSAEIDFVGDVRPVQTRELRRRPPSIIAARTIDGRVGKRRHAKEYGSRYECFDTYWRDALRCHNFELQAGWPFPMQAQVEWPVRGWSITLVTSSSTHAQQTNTSFSEYHA